MRALLMASLAICFASNAYSQTRHNYTLPNYEALGPHNETDGPPATFPNGLDNTTAIPKVYSDGTSGTLAQIGQMADGSVQQTDIGKTVSALSANQTLGNPLISGGDRLGGWQNNFDNSTLNPYVSFEADMFGGIDPYVSNGIYGGIPRNINLTSDPYGPYSMGCGQQITTYAPNHWYQLFPVSEKNIAIGSQGVVDGGGFDIVAQCILAGNQQARLRLDIKSFTDGSFVISDDNMSDDGKTPGLTTEQAALLHPNMYITTNVIDPNLKNTNPDGQLKPKKMYAGFVRGQPKPGDTSISVWGWGVPAIGSGVKGQIPDLKNLDTDYSKYDHGVAFFGSGAADHSFVGNWFQNINIDDLAATDSTQSFIHSISPLEIDLNMYSATGKTSSPPDHSLYYGGMAFSIHNFPNALTSDSFEMMLGGDIHNHIIFDGAPGNWNMSGDGFFLPSGPVYGVSGSHIQQLSAEWDQLIDGQDTLRTALWYEIGNSGSGNTGWKRGVVHLGALYTNGSLQEPPASGDITATKNLTVKLGDLEFNHGDRYGSVSLCGSSVNCGLSVYDDGSTHANNLYISAGQNTGGNDVLLQNGNLYQKAEIALKNSADNSYAGLHSGYINSEGSISSSGGITSGDTVKIRNKGSLIFSQDGTDNFPEPTLGWVDQSHMIFSVPSIQNQYVSLEMGGDYVTW